MASQCLLRLLRPCLERFSGKLTPCPETKMEPAKKNSSLALMEIHGGCFGTRDAGIRGCRLSRSDAALETGCSASPSLTNNPNALFLARPKGAIESRSLYKIQGSLVRAISTYTIDVGRVKAPFLHSPHIRPANMHHFNGVLIRRRCSAKNE
jgi:hypothetical protein